MNPKKLKKIESEERKQAIVFIPETITKHVKAYQSASRRRFNKAKPTKADLIVKMACIGLDAFVEEYKEFIKQAKELNL